LAACPSCRNDNPPGVAFCEACGAAMPDDSGSDDGVLSMMLGLVCPNCDSYNDPGTASCMLCGHQIGDGGSTDIGGGPPAPAAPAPATADAGVATPAWMQAPEGQPLATANAMPAVDLNVLKQQSSGGLAAPSGSDPAIPVQQPAPAPVSALPGCPSCSGEIKPDDKFCRHCGHRLDGGGQVAAALPSAKLSPAGPSPAGTMVMPSLSVPKPVARQPTQAPSATMFFGAASVERFARLTLVKGHTQFGTQWRLQAGETVIGRTSGMVLFPDDSYLAARHCRVEFRGEDLWLVPEDEANGVYLRIRQPENLAFGGDFVIGVQRMRLIGPAELPRAVNGPAPGDDTRLLGTEVPVDSFAVKRVFQDPNLAEVYFRPQRVLSIGRARCDVNFPDDPFLSGRHAQLTRTTTGATLEDLGSRNGTFIRVVGDRKLGHGDVIMLGEQVLRVEVSLSLARG
jgi:hypothetical protein